jgi:hypothetical protein
MRPLQTTDRLVVSLQDGFKVKLHAVPKRKFTTGRSREQPSAFRRPLPLEPELGQYFDDVWFYRTISFSLGVSTFTTFTENLFLLVEV